MEIRKFRRTRNMDIGIVGSGMVGKTIGAALIKLDHRVKLGTRSPGKVSDWVEANGTKASGGTFAEAAQFGEMLFLCTKGEATLDALAISGPSHFTGKVVVDITNPLDFSNGMPPSLLSRFANTNSLGEEVQKALPGARVVKSLNIVNCEVMVNPRKSGGDPTMFVSGNDAAAKQSVIGILKSFGWKDIIDLGDISTARGTEMMLPIWVRLWMATQNGYIGFKVVR
jgi:hypothetical protein